MAALEEGLKRTYKGGSSQESSHFPVQAGAKIYAGSALEKNVLGQVAPADGSGVFAGFAAIDCDNTDGLAGTRQCHVDEVGIVLVDVPGSGSSTFGDAVTATTDNDFALTGGMTWGSLYQQTATGSTSWYVSFKGAGLA